jgi:hypothetical protein
MWNIEVGDGVYRTLCGALADRKIREQITERSGHLPPILVFSINDLVDEANIIDAKLFRIDDQHILIEFDCDTVIKLFDLVIPLEHIREPVETTPKNNKRLWIIFLFIWALSSILFSSSVMSKVTQSKEGKMVEQRHISYTKEDLDVMAQNLYFEERSYKITDVAIAQIGYVVLNRVNKKHWPNTIKEVVWQRKQFSWTHDGKSDKMKNPKAKKRAYAIAKAVLEGTIPNLIGDADHYLNRNKSKAMWWRGMKFKGRHGDHWFYTR